MKRGFKHWRRFLREAILQRRCRRGVAVLDDMLLAFDRGVGAVGRWFDFFLVLILICPFFFFGRREEREGRGLVWIFRVVFFLRFYFFFFLFCFVRLLGQF